MPAGKYTNPRRKITAPAEDFNRWDAVARAAGMTWAEWVVGLMRAASPAPVATPTEHLSDKDQEST